MRVALFARPQLRKPVAELVRAAGADPIVLPQPRDGKELRFFAHQKQPDAVVIDAALASDWDPIKAIPRLALVKSRPEVIALFAGLSEKARRRALFAGAKAIVDGDAWAVDLAEQIAKAAARPRQAQGVFPTNPPELSAPPALRIVR